MEKKQNRIEWIDNFKACACFLVVLGHLIQSLKKANIDHGCELTTYINWFIYLFHMPAFLAISGFLYNLKRKEFNWKNYKEFEVKKIVNLLVPYIFFYVLYLSINICFSSSVNSPKGIDELIGILNNPMSPYWFLYALIALFIVIPIIEKILKSKKNVLICMLILKLISFFYVPNVYFIKVIMMQGIYFYIGCVIQLYKSGEWWKKIIFGLVYVISSIAIYINKKKINDFMYFNMECIMGIIGTVGMLYIFYSKNNIYLFKTFRNFTFEIYLMHTIFAAGIRIVLLKIGIVNYIIHLVFGIISSIYIPVIISVISKKIKFSQIVFYPVNTIKYYKERKS